MIAKKLFVTYVPVLTGLGFSKQIITLQNPPPRPIEPDKNTGCDWWRPLPRIPITTSAEPRTKVLCRAAAEKRLVSITYNGTTYLGIERRVLPLSVFKVEGYNGTYVHAVCTMKDAERTFLIEKIYRVIEEKI